VAPPRTGVEVVKSEKRKGTTYYSIRDLRNNHIVHNITRSSARKLWQYAITEFQDHPVDPSKVKWIDSLGLWNAHKRAGKMRYDLVLRGPNGHLFIYYGVTEDGIHGSWRSLIESEPSLEVETVEDAVSRETESSAIQLAEAEAPLEIAHETATMSPFGEQAAEPSDDSTELSGEGVESAHATKLGDVEPTIWEGRVEPLPYSDESIIDASFLPDSTEPTTGSSDSTLSEESKGGDADAKPGESSDSSDTERGFV
jgi:hypothetical protein